MIIRARDIIPWWWDNVVLVFQDEEGEEEAPKVTGEVMGSS